MYKKLGTVQLKKIHFLKHPILGSWIMKCLTMCCNTVHFRYIAVYFLLLNHEGRGMVVLRELLVWLQFTLEFIVLWAVSCYIVPRYIVSIESCRRLLNDNVSSTKTYSKSTSEGTLKHFVTDFVVSDVHVDCLTYLGTLLLTWFDRHGTTWKSIYILNLRVGYD